MVKKTVIKIIERFIAAVEKEGITLDKVILYGSYAKGKERRDSDIDIAVVSKDFGKDRTEEGMLLFRIAGEIDTRLEPVPIAAKSLRQGGKSENNDIA
ncbi:MAG: nucleotidyltransferase domain-containing protein [Deltaproteobacteria bacterium]